MTYYEILGVPLTATQAEIKQAYRAQIKYFHPDVCPENPEIAKIKTIELNKIYNVLSDPDKRKNYDQTIFASSGRGNRSEPNSDKKAKQSAEQKAEQKTEQKTEQDVKWKVKQNDRQGSYKNSNQHSVHLNVNNRVPIRFFVFLFVLTLLCIVFHFSRVHFYQNTAAKSSHPPSINQAEAEEPEMSSSEPHESLTDTSEHFVYYTNSISYHNGTCGSVDGYTKATEEEAVSKLKRPCYLCFGVNYAPEFAPTCTPYFPKTNTNNANTSSLSSSKHSQVSSAPASFGYIGNKKTKKFHKSTCSYLPDASNRVTLSTRSVAISNGYDSCAHCDP